MKKLLLLLPLLLMLGGCAYGGKENKTTPADIYQYTYSGNLINHWEAVSLDHSGNGDILYFEDTVGKHHWICGSFVVDFKN